MQMFNMRLDLVNVQCHPLSFISFFFLLNLWFVFTGARMMYHLDPKRQAEAIALATRLDKDVEGVTIEVIRDSMALL